MLTLSGLDPSRPADDQAEIDRCRQLGEAAVFLSKSAGPATISYGLAGRLICSKSGWGLLEVPNALIRGAFDALHEIGAELPPSHGKNLRAHISVLRPEELEQIGGVDRVAEFGHTFRFTLGPLREVEPEGWSEMSKVWFIEVRSPELEKLRKSYGLSATPKNGEFQFHITVAVKRKKVTHPGTAVTKAAGSVTIPCNGNRVTGVEDATETLRSMQTKQGDDIVLDRSEPIGRLPSVLQHLSEGVSGSQQGQNQGEGSLQVSRQLAAPNEVRWPFKAGRAPGLAEDDLEMHEREVPRLQGLRRPRDHGMPKVAGELPQLLQRYRAATESEAHSGTEGNERQLRAGKLLLGYSQGATAEQEKQSDDRSVRSVAAVGSLGRGDRVEGFDVASSFEDLDGGEGVDAPGSLKQANDTVSDLLLVMAKVAASFGELRKARQGFTILRGVNPSTYDARMRSLGQPGWVADKVLVTKKPLPGERVVGAVPNQADLDEARALAASPYSSSVGSYDRRTRIGTTTATGVHRTGPDVGGFLGPITSAGHKTPELQLHRHERMHGMIDAARVDPANAVAIPALGRLSLGLQKSRFGILKDLGLIAEEVTSNTAEKPGTGYVSGLRRFSGVAPLYQNQMRTALGRWLLRRMPIIKTAGVPEPINRLLNLPPIQDWLADKSLQGNLVYSDGRNLAIQARHRAERRMAWDAAKQNAKLDQPKYQEFLGGLATLSGAKPNPKLLDRASNDMATLSPYIATMFAQKRGSAEEVMPFLDDIIALVMAHRAKQNNPTPTMPHLSMGLEPTAVEMPKVAKVHGTSAVTVQRRDAEVLICPHCGEELKAKDIYRDAKGWTFCRPCFRKGKGSIKIPEWISATEKSAIEAVAARSDTVPSLSPDNEHLARCSEPVDTTEFLMP